VILPTGKRFIILIIAILIGIVVLDDIIARVIHWILLH